MEDPNTLLLLLILVSELALIAAILGGIGWYMYRKASRTAQSASAEKKHLEDRREAYLVFLGDRMRELNVLAKKPLRADEEFQALARRFLHEERMHTEAAKDRDSMIWDLRMDSTQKLIKLFREISAAYSGKGIIPSASGEQPTAGSTQQTVTEQNSLIDRQRQEIQELSSFREAWMRLHRYAMRESVAAARLRSALHNISNDPATRQAIETELQTHASDRDALDDYLNSTAASYEEAHPEDMLRARRQQRRMNRTHQVVDGASSRIDEANKRLPALFQDQNLAITELEAKLQQATATKDSIKYTYNKEIQRLKSNNREATRNVSSLEKDNRRLRERVRNLIRLSKEGRGPFVPPVETKAKRYETNVLKNHEATVDHLKELIRQEREKNAELQQIAKKYRDLEAFLRTTLETKGQH